jgi:hypothetical protein
MDKNKEKKQKKLENNKKEKMTTKEESYSLGNFSVSLTTTTTEIKNYCDSKNGNLAFDNNASNCYYFFQGLFNNWNIHRDKKLVQESELSKLSNKLIGGSDKIPSVTISSSTLEKEKKEKEKKEKSRKIVYWILLIIGLILLILLFFGIFSRQPKLPKKEEIVTKIVTPRETITVEKVEPKFLSIGGEFGRQSLHQES